MGEKKDNVIKTYIVLVIMIVAPCSVDIYYHFGNRCWQVFWVVAVLKSLNITYYSSYKILSTSFGVIITMVSMFLTISNNISERFEKKAYGIPRAQLYEEEHVLYRCLRRICLCAPVLMLSFLNLQWCVCGYCVFIYCISFLWLHYRRYVSSYDKSLLLKGAINVLQMRLPESDIWTTDTLSKFQAILENIGESAEEEGNWIEVEKLYFELLAATKGYNYEKRYLITFYFYRIVFWRREKRSFIAPMGVLRTYLSKLDRKLGEWEIDVIPESQWPVLWGMMRVAVCEASEEELIKFLEAFYDFATRSSNVVQSTGVHSLSLKVMEEQAGMLLVLLEYRFVRRPPEDMQCIELLRTAWECGSRSCKDKKYECFYRMSAFAQSSFEEDRIALELVLENLRCDCCSNSRKSLIANIITIRIGR